MMSLVISTDRTARRRPTLDLRPITMHWMSPTRFAAVCKAIYTLCFTEGLSFFFLSFPCVDWDHLNGVRHLERTFFVICGSQ